MSQFTGKLVGSDYFSHGPLQIEIFALEIREQRMPADRRAQSAAQSSQEVTPASGGGSRSASWMAVAGKAGAVLAFVLSTGWAAYTYSSQQREQKLQDLVQAYNLVHGELGQSISASLEAANEPIYNRTDPEFWATRLAVDAAKTDADKKNETEKMRNWILHNILVKGKDPTHDQYVANYQQALGNLAFLYQYAKTGPCAAAIVVSRFRQAAFTFWYYYPGSYNLDDLPPQSPEPFEYEAQILGEPAWAEKQQRLCMSDIVSDTFSRDKHF